MKVITRQLEMPGIPIIMLIVTDKEQNCKHL